VVAPNIWREMHQRLFIFLPKIVNMWSMETTNKGKIVGVGKIGTNPSTSIKKCFTYWWSYAWFIKYSSIMWLRSLVQQVASNDTKRTLVFDWLLLMIVFESYVDCLWWLLLIEFWLPWWLSLRVLLIIDYFWWFFFIEFWLSLMIVFESYVDYWLLLMIAFLLLYILIIYTEYVFLWVQNS